MAVVVLPAASIVYHLARMNPAQVLVYAPSNDAVETPSVHPRTVSLQRVLKGTASSLSDSPASLSSFGPRSASIIRRPMPNIRPPPPLALSLEALSKFGQISRLHHHVLLRSVLLFHCIHPSLTASANTMQSFHLPTGSLVHLFGRPERSSRAGVVYRLYPRLSSPPARS
jgi:hypothetical protein